MQPIRDVTDRSGRVLLRAGVELTNKHLRILQTWGVTHLHIRDDQAPEGSNEDYAPKPVEISPQRRREIEQEVERLFSHHDPNNPVSASLRHYCLSRRIGLD